MAVFFQLTLRYTLETTPCPTQDQPPELAGGSLLLSFQGIRGTTAPAPFLPPVQPVYSRQEGAISTELRVIGTPII